MKKLSLIAALTLSTMLSACGGGGGGGQSFLPPTIPDVVNPDNPQMVENSKITSMAATDDMNTEKRTKLANAAEAATPAIATYSMKKMARARTLTREAPENDDKIQRMYDDMKRFLVENNFTGATVKDLYQALLLAGFSKEELNEVEDGNFENWIKSEDRIASVRLKAQRVLDKYGKEKVIAQDNAILRHVNIDGEQDSYISLELENGKIKKLHTDVSVEHPDARRDTMEFKEIDSNGRAVFEKSGPTYVWGANFENGPRIWLEIWDKFADTTSEEGWAKLIDTMVEEVENDYKGNNKEKYIEEIKALELADFKKCEDSECMNTAYGPFYGGFDNALATVAYESYAKKVGETGLQYSDFGVTIINSYEGAQFNKDDVFVFAGGYDAKRIAKDDLQNGITFKGKAVATVLNQDETTGTRVQHSKIYDGTSELTFAGGVETLKTTFDGWYDVDVVSNNNKNYNVTFKNGDKISAADAEFFKYTTKPDTFVVNDFVQNPENDYPYGAVDIGYYDGGKGNPIEAAGFIAYGEQHDGVDLHSQIGFGAKKD